MTNTINTTVSTGILGWGEYRARLQLLISQSSIDLIADEVHNSFNGRTFDEFHQRVIVLETSAKEVIADAARIGDIAERLQPLAQRVQAGLSVDWDGSNYVGSLSDDARDAVEEINLVFDGLDHADWCSNVAVWDIRDYLCDEFAIDLTAESSDEHVAALAAEYEAAARRDDVALIYSYHHGDYTGWTTVSSMEGYLTAMRDELRAAAADDEA